jgi:Predicted integral membrane protein (DUF2189)
VLENVEPRLVPSGPASSIQVRKLTLTDVVGSLRSGWDDFMAYPSHAVMLAIIYPIVGLLIARVLQGYSFLPLLFPLSTGFALLGPFAAIVFYDLSRRRERGGILVGINLRRSTRCRNRSNFFWPGRDHAGIGTCDLALVPQGGKLCLMRNGHGSRTRAQSVVNPLSQRSDPAMRTIPLASYNNRPEMRDGIRRP